MKIEIMQARRARANAAAFARAPLPRALCKNGMRSASGGNGAAVPPAAERAARADRSNQ